MNDLVNFIRVLARVAFVLAFPALLLGLWLLFVALAPGLGDGGLGDAIALALGNLLLILGGAGLIFGGLVTVLAKRSLAAPAEIRGSRRIALTTGLAVASGEVLIAAVLGGPLLVIVDLSAAFAAAFLVVAVASGRRGDLVRANVLAVGLFGLGVVSLGAQALQRDSTALTLAREALLPVDMHVAIDVAAGAAPDGWAVATIVFRGTNLGNNAYRDLPEELIGHPLRGLVVIDCAGSDALEVVTGEGDLAHLLASIPCHAEPQVLPFEIQGVTDSASPPRQVLYTYASAVPDEGPAGGMNRVMVLVAMTGTPDPDPDALITAFEAAFGTEEPR